jgi:hypothetical protein
MKRLLIPIFILALLLGTGRIYSQNNDYPIHLFLGEFKGGTASDTTIEMWDQIDDNTLAGKTVYVYSEGSFLSETMRILYRNGKLTYCAILMEQDPDNPQGEVCFELKTYKDLVFTFENLKHDSPKRIIYNFENWHNVIARVEDETKGYDLQYWREYNMFQSYTTNGVIVKEPFKNKVGEIIGGVYDYYFKTQGIKYFIKLRDGAIKKEDLEKVLNKAVKVTFFINDGLWDTDDNTHQSRIGKYIRIANIY